MKLKIILLILVIINLLPLVNSQTYYDSNIGFSPFSLFPFDLSFPGILDFYNSNYQWVDFFISLALFAIISKATLEDKFGSAAPIITAAILAIGFSSLERKYEFNLSYFGPIAVLIILIWFFHLLFKRAESHKGASIASISVVGIVILVLLYNYGFSNTYVAYGGSGLTLIALILIIYLISKSSQGNTSPAQVLSASPTTQTPTTIIKEKEAIEAITQKAREEQELAQKTAQEKAQREAEEKEFNQIKTMTSHLHSLLKEGQS